MSLMMSKNLHAGGRIFTSTLTKHSIHTPTSYYYSRIPTPYTTITGYFSCPNFQIMLLIAIHLVLSNFFLQRLFCCFFKNKIWTMRSGIIEVRNVYAYNFQQVYTKQQRKDKYTVIIMVIFVRSLVITEQCTTIPAD